MCTNGFRHGSTDFLPTFSVPCQQVLVTRELLVSGRQGTVNISILCSRPCTDEAKKAETLVWGQATDQGENIFGAQVFWHQTYFTRE
jgi:post-segregation antitoxin (ccd killing protein)